MKRLAALLGLVAVHAAIAQAPRVRDSAGIQIVENPARMAAPIAFRLGDKPLVDVGGIQDNLDAELGRNVQGVRLSDGRVAVADGSNIKYFSTAGKFIKATGHKGRGPNEIQQLGRFCRIRGDTLIGFDGGNSRYVILDAQGQIIRTIPTTSYLPSRTCFDDGTALRTEGRADLTDREHPLQHYVAFGSDGNTRRDLGMLPGLGLLSIFHMTLVTIGDRIYLGDGKASEVRTFDGAGKLIRIVRSSDALVPVTDAEAAAGRGVATISFTAMAPGGGAMGPTETKSNRAATWPAFNVLSADQSGRLWVEDSPRSENRGWTAFDPTGKIIGRLVTAAHAKDEEWHIESFGVNDVQVSHKDSDGAVHLTWYGLVAVR